MKNGADVPLGKTVFPGQLAEIGAVKLPKDGLTAQVAFQCGTLGKIQKLAAGGVDDLEKHLLNIASICMYNDVHPPAFVICIAGGCFLCKYLKMTPLRFVIL